MPKSVKRAINESSYVFRAGKPAPATAMPARDADAGEVLEELTREMLEAADNLEFERAAYLRDQIAELKGKNREPRPKKGGKPGAKGRRRSAK